MEQYIYLFTILLEVIVCVQLSQAIYAFDKKITKLNDEVLDIKKEVELALLSAKKIISKFNRVAGIIVKVKYSKTKKFLLIGIDIISMFFLFKSFKTYRGLSKLKFVRKLFSFSFVRGIFSLIKEFI